MKTLALVIAFATLGACTTRTIEAAELESKIKADGVSKGWPIKTVECPKNQPFKAGDKFDCTMTFEDGKSTTTTVDQKDDKGSVEWTTVNIVDVNVYVDAISKKHGGIAVKCPATKWMIAKPADTFECSGMLKGEKASWVVTVNKDGTFDANPTH